jgi:hypothetical protein
MMDFPSSPVVGQAYLFSVHTWVWNGVAWEYLQFGFQAPSVFKLVGPMVEEVTAELPAPVNGTSRDSPLWSLVTYV